MEQKMLTITEQAVLKFKEFFASEPEAKGKSLRVAIQEGGCCGSKFVLAFDDKRSGDQEIPYDGFAVVVDSSSAPLLTGTTIDYGEDARGAGFKVSRPVSEQKAHSHKSGGCGGPASGGTASSEAPRSEGCGSESGGGCGCGSGGCGCGSGGCGSESGSKEATSKSGGCGSGSCC